MFPGASSEQKVKAMNYLLPHIRRMPEKLARDQFALDAAQKLNIDSAVLREELRQAALKRRDRVETRAVALTEVERVLLRALAITDPDDEEARRLAAQALAQNPAWFEQLGTFAALQALATRAAIDPMDAVEDEAQRALLAEALLAETKPPTEEMVSDALAWHEASLIENQLRKVRSEMAETERQSGWEEALRLNQSRVMLERRLSELKASGLRGRGDER
jgi:DNA primase